MFGEGCLSHCGQCAVNLQCHHINGACLNGCKPGYTSQLCNQRKWILFKGQCKLLQWKLKVYFQAKLCKVVCWFEQIQTQVKY